MGRLRRVTTQVTYQVPAWFYCNGMSMRKPGQPTEELCRFCVKEKNLYRCTLYNMRLGTADGILVCKTEECKRASSGFKSAVEDIPDAPEQLIPPKTIAAEAINAYIKVRAKLLHDGYPAAMVDKLAKDFVLKEK